MVLHSMLRRASSSVLPLAIRAVGSPRTFHRAISTVLSVEKGGLSHEFNPRNSVSFLRFSTATLKKRTSDESLIQVIESEIEHAEQEDNKTEVEDIRDGFPFEIEDNPGQRTILLRREYQDEAIKVEVDMPNVATGEDDDDDKDDDDDDEQPSIPLVVSIAKGSGLCLEFGLTAFPDEITIDSLSIKKPEGFEDELAYEGPDFNDLDENLQKAFHKYLEIRGIKPSTTNLLHDYMAKKDSKEYLLWLVNLKNFIEK